MGVTDTRDRLTTALWRVEAGPKPGTPEREADALLAADPHLAADIEVGAALRALGGALPEGYAVMIRTTAAWGSPGRSLTLIDAYHFDGRRKSWRWEADTLPEAIAAALDALREREGP